MNFPRTLIASTFSLNTSTVFLLTVIFIRGDIISLNPFSGNLESSPYIEDINWRPSLLFFGDERHRFFLPLSYVQECFLELSIMCLEFLDSLFKSHLLLK